MGRAAVTLAASMFVIAGLGTVARSAEATPTSTRECLAAHEEAQTARHANKLWDARGRFVACSTEACPVDIRKECSTQLDELDARLPSIVVDVRDHGVSTADARVSVDGALAAERLTGAAIPVDPGTRVLRVECRGGRVREQTILLSEGDKLHRLVVDCDGDSGAAEHPSPPATREPPSPPPRSRAIPAATWILGGIAVAALAGFTTFAVLGRSKESSLADSCRPHCTDDQVAPAHTRYLIADVSLIIAALSASGAIAIALWPHSGSGPGTMP
jgi:hypothetical protein